MLVVFQLYSQGMGVIRIYCNGHVNRKFDWEREIMDNDETFYLNTCY
jgi:hypothetical protein